MPNIPQSELNGLYREGNWPERLQRYSEKCIRDERVDPTARPDAQTIRKRLYEYRGPDEELVAVIFVYDRIDGHTRTSPKMLLIDGVRHCSLSGI